LPVLARADPLADDQLFRLGAARASVPEQVPEHPAEQQHAPGRESEHQGEPVRPALAAPAQGRVARRAAPRRGADEGPTCAALDGWAGNEAPPRGAGAENSWQAIGTRQLAKCNEKPAPLRLYSLPLPRPPLGLFGFGAPACSAVAFGGRPLTVSGRASDS